MQQLSHKKKKKQEDEAHLKWYKPDQTACEQY